MGPKKGPDGTLAITLPMGDKKLPGIATEDIGKCAYGIFQRREWIGKTIGIAGEHLTGAEMAAAFYAGIGSGGSLQRCFTRRLPQARFPWSRATCFSSSATSMTSSAALATWTSSVR